MNIKAHVAMLALYTALVFLMTLPIGLHMVSRIAGTGGDPWQAMWRFEMKSQDIGSEFAKDVLGTGEARLVNLSVWPWMPLHILLGEPLGYNTIFLLNFVLAGYAMALFVKMLTNAKSILEPAPMLAGIAYMFLPFHSAHALGHFGAMQLQWIPFIAVTVLTYIRNPRIWKAILLGALLTIQAWQEHHYMVWIAIFGAISVFVYRKEIREKIRKPEVSSHAIVLFAMFVFGVVVPYIPTMRLALTNNSALALGTKQTIRFSADLFSFITPPPWHPIWGGISSALFGSYFTGNEAESVQYLSIVMLIAILFFLKHIPVRQKRLWLVTIFVFGVISLGPLLHLFGRVTSIPLPYALLANLPVFSAIRVVARAGVFVGFATTVLFGWVIATNLAKKNPSTSERRAPYVIAGLLLLEFLCIPFPMQSAKLSPAYSDIKRVLGSRIIEIPSATNYTSASRALFATTIHHKDVLGNIALERGQGADAFQLEKSVPGVRQLLYLRTTELLENRREFFNQNLAETLPDAMEWLDAEAILVHSDSLSQHQNKALESILSTLPWLTKTEYPDANLYVKDTMKALNSDGVFLMRGDGFENVGYDPKRQSTFAEIQNEATVTLVNINKHPVRVELRYSLAEKSNGNLAMHFNDSDSTGESVLLSPGEHTILFRHTGEGRSIIQNPALIVNSL